MGANDAVHDAVAAKIAAHNAAILADLSKPRRRKATAGGRRKKAKSNGVAGEQPLFGQHAPHTESFGQTRDRLADVELPRRLRLSMVRRTEVRCTECDYRLVVRSAKVICPHCGMIYGDPTVLRALVDAFPGATLLGDGPTE